MGNLISTSAGLFKRRVASIYDADAQTYFDAVAANGGSLTVPEKTAVNNLVLCLKANGTWAKKVAIYPIAGGTAASHAINLKNPALYKLTFGGSITHSATGMKFNGSGFANTGAAPNVVFTTTSGHMSFYSRTSGNAAPGGGYDMGVSQASGGATSTFAILCKASDGKSYAAMGNDAGQVNSSILSGGGLYVASQNGVPTYLYLDGSVASQANVGNSLPTFPIFIGANDGGGTAELFSSRECAYADIGVAHTAGEVEADNTCIQDYQIALGRQFTQPASFDPDAQAFIDAVTSAGGTLSTTEKNALDNLVKGFKTNGTWAKKIGVWPLIGGSAVAHKFNLKDPRDLDAAYRLTYHGSVPPSHSSTGMQYTGAGYAHSHFTANLFGNTSAQLGVYIRGAAAAAAQIEIGAYSGVSTAIMTNWADSAVRGGMCGSSIVFSITTGAGYTVENFNGTSGKGFRNGTLRMTDTSPVPATAGVNDFLYFGAHNDNGTAAYFSTKEACYIEIGTHHTDSEIAADYTTIQAFQVALGREAAAITLEAEQIFAYLQSIGIFLTAQQTIDLMEIINAGLPPAPPPAGAPDAVLMEMAADEAFTLPYEVVEYLRSEGFVL